MIETYYHNRRSRRLLWMGAVFLVGLGGAEARAELGEEIDRAENQVSALENKADLVLHEYIRFEDKTLESTRFETRLTDAQAMMLLQDYGRASVVFYDLVEDLKNRNHPAYQDGLFGLAEVLYANRNFIDAKKYFLRLLERNPRRRYLISTLTRLMEIALRTNEFGRVDEFYRQIVKEFKPAPAMATYLWAKTLAIRGRLQEAAQAFSSLAPDDSLYCQARYYLGVVLVQQSRLEDALQVFDVLSKAEARSKQEENVLELANLARGRLLHDLGRETQALDAYQAIEHTSVHFDSSLFEICWTYLQRAEKAEQPENTNKWYIEALRTVEILEVSTPNSTLVPKTKLLKGHILEKLGKFEQANEIFREVSRTYSSVKQELENLMVQHDDPVQYFNEVAGKNLDSFDLRSYLPPMAVKWITGQDEMATALDVVRDIEVGRRFVQEARASLGKLELLLRDEQDRFNLFPLIRDGAKRVLEIENNRVHLERRLAWLEERIVIEHISAEEQEKLNLLRNERLQLESLVGNLPASQEEFDSREIEIRKRIDLLEKAVYESGIALKGMKAQLRAMDEWTRLNQDKLTGKERAVAEFREEIRRGWKIANKLEGELENISVFLATEKSRAGLDSQTLSEEAKLRQRYMAALRKERELAEQLHSRLSSEGTSQIHRINDLRLRIDKVRRKLQIIGRELNAKVDKKAKSLRAQASSEEKRLRAFEQALDRLEKESENLAGNVAYKTLEELRKRFSRLVLDADVGVLDVAWRQKQEKTREITDLSRKQSADQKRLYREYKSVLEEAP